MDSDACHYRAVAAALSLPLFRHRSPTLPLTATVAQETFPCLLCGRQELATLFTALARNTDARAASWVFFKSHAATLLLKFVGCSGMLISALLTAPLVTFADAAVADDAAAFFPTLGSDSERGGADSEHDVIVRGMVSGSALAIAHALDGIRARAACLDTAGESLAVALAAKLADSV